MSNIKSVRFIGEHQTYDLELEHPDHQFYLSNGVLTSNSHAIMYSFISYVTAYLKANHPIEFLLANLMSDIRSNAPDAEGNIDKAKMELRAHGVKILPPNINHSSMEYKLIDGKTLLTGLDALKFVGDDSIIEILDKRPFHSFDDFMTRIETGKVRSSAIQALAAVGAMDQFGISRRSIYLYVSDYRKKLQVWLKKHDPKTEKFTFPWTEEFEWSKSELFALEKHYLGEVFICSKKEAFGNFFNSKTHTKLSIIQKSKNKTIFQSIKAEIKSIFELKVKKENSRLLGQEMAKVTIEDEFGTQMGLTIFPENWSQVKKYVKSHKGRVAFEPGFAIHFSGSCNVYENEMGIILNELFEIVSPPMLPKDLKAKKISVKNAVQDKVTPQATSLIEELEDELLTEGLVDLDEDPFSVDI